MSFLMSDIKKELKIRTKEVASPMAMPLITALEMARVGHIPSIWRNIGFSCHRPLRKSWPAVLLAMHPSERKLAFFTQSPGFLPGRIDDVEDGFRRYGRPGYTVELGSGETLRSRGGRLAQAEGLGEVLVFP